MKKYNHLTAANRSVIQVLHQENYTLTDIANKIGCHKSTISREIRSRSVRSGSNLSLLNVITKQIEKDARGIPNYLL